MVLISPSILSADCSNLKQEIKMLEESGADMIHIDSMDGNFVPNIKFTSSEIQTLRSYTNLPFDVHLMINQPEQHITSYINSGADLITIHPESTNHLYETILTIKKANIKAGIALLSSTSIDILSKVIDYIDLILVMTVKPGFSGQKFISSQLNKISQISQMISTHDTDILLGVDGGINDKTANLCYQAGANMIIAGNYIFQGVYGKQIESLRS